MSDPYDQRLTASIKRHEGFRNKAYKDSVGVWTIGYGTNLQELEISEELASSWLYRDIVKAYEGATRFPEWEYLDTVARRNVFIEMVYNMGPSRVAGFRNMLRAIREQDWSEAALEMLDSKWARQVGVRAKRLSKLMREGEYGDEA